MNSSTDPLKGLVLPPMPEALRIVREESAREDPDMARITAAISADVSLSAEVLRVINSPAFGKRSIASIPNAIMLLGLGNVTNVVASVALRSRMNKLGQMELNRFWDSAGDVAVTCAQVARQYTGIPADAAYSLGLFHDCGIPLLMARHADYAEVVWGGADQGQSIADRESQHFNISHSTVGFYISRGWHLPTEISQGILHHHKYESVMRAPPPGVSENVRVMLSVLKLAEHVSSSFRTTAFGRAESEGEWARIEGQVLEHLGIGALEFEDLKDSLFDMLGRA